VHAINVFLLSHQQNPVIKFTLEAITRRVVDPARTQSNHIRLSLARCFHHSEWRIGYRCETIGSGSVARTAAI
jgi:hypothetical protein